MPQLQGNQPTTLPTEWEVTTEAIPSWYTAHPDAVLGQDVRGVILAERRLAAADQVRATWPDLPEQFVTDALPKDGPTPVHGRRPTPKVG